MRIDVSNSIFEVKTTTRFNKELKKNYKQNRNIEKLIEVVEKLANNQELDLKYRNHKLKK